MLLQLEQLAVEGAGHVEAAIAVQPARVAERDADLVLRHVGPVEPGHPHVRKTAAHLPLPLLLGRRYPARHPSASPCRRLINPRMNILPSFGVIVTPAAE